MTDTEPSRQARAAETKKRRTRLKLIHAAEHVMNEEGMAATVEHIVEEAGVSTATFYTFYPSRNALCVDAFNELVVSVLEQTITPGQSMLDRALAIWNLCTLRSYLLRAAMMERLEHPTQYPTDEATGQQRLGLEFDVDAIFEGQNVVRVEWQEVHDFVDSIAYLLWQPLPADKFAVGLRLDTALHMAALEILDAAASRRAIYLDRLAWTVVGGLLSLDEGAAPGHGINDTFIPERRYVMSDGRSSYAGQVHDAFLTIETIISRYTILILHLIML